MKKQKIKNLSLTKMKVSKLNLNTIHGGGINFPHSGGSNCDDPVTRPGGKPPMPSGN
jgi:hypothetical protein